MEIQHLTSRLKDILIDPENANMETFPIETTYTCKIPATNENPLCLQCQTLYTQLEPYIEDKTIPQANPPHRRGSIKLTKLKGTIHPDELNQTSYPFTWYMSTDFRRIPNDTLVDEMGEHLLQVLPYVLIGNVRIHAALVENDGRVTAHFMIDADNGRIPEKKWFRGMWTRYAADYDSLEIYDGGSDPLRRRLLFFKAALDVDELNLEYDVH
ncbi:hypothetical protein ASPVEDRAFT_27499 [Aspergillus versicolor CBS 583.65]|uniref:Uncharacterized protein n=1 Tax=Aspergillus versicolor CBS 583.65 TaxID=1036611 RepID=A0A1L9PH59_ASPVE|nr:uncharacterized protein ASPVEDRAFT_27499 [Aspergillus versicolor CBS 583.65]OJJ00785.1 hypothetical protein ASPVEDRAFT_27499 [Aspergillus versicolor CBS 583.65]